MGDYYDATLEVLGWPASAIRTERRAGYPDPYDQDRLDLEALGGHGLCPCCELLSLTVAVADGSPDAGELEQPLACARCEEVSEQTAWSKLSECEQLAAELGYLSVDNDDAEFEPYGDERFGLLRVTGSHGGGSFAFEEHGITGLLRELGLAYYVSDEGYAEFPGSFEAWRPGWSALRSGTCTQDGPVLTPPDWQRILAEARSLEQAGRLAGSWFDSRTEALGLGEIQRALGPANG